MTMMPNLDIEMISTDKLVPYAGNAKEHPEWQVDQICNSIEQFGFDDPVAVWTNDAGEPVIVEGHGRLLAAKQLGIDAVPCIRLDHLDDDARRAYTLVHNKLTTNTGYDEDILAAEISSLGDFNMEDFGFGAVDEFVDMNIDGVDTGKASAHTVKIDGTTYLVAADECQMFKDGFDEYVSKNKHSLGYIRSLYE